MNAGKYTVLELFVRSEEGKGGMVCVLSEDGSRRIEKAGDAYYAWLKFPLKRETDYEIEIRDAKVTLAYLSGSEDIMDTGVCFLDCAYGRVTNEKFSSHYDTSIREQYHFVPWKNWINDPNGLCWYQGRYHMFYQMNPHGQEWSNMYWGHAASRDLVHWVHLPVVLEPQKEVLLDPDRIKGGAFSGCAVPLEDQVLFYLTRHLGPLEDGEETVQQQWMFSSRDMLNFTQEELVIGERPEGVSFDFRDPKVLKIQEDWYLVLASARNGKATILLYKSKDLKNWTYLYPLLTEETADIRCFECPDFFSLDDSYVAMGAWMCHSDEQSRYQMCRYYIGDWKEEKFWIRSQGWYDFGSNCYAMQSFEHEGRRICIGWISDFYQEHVPETEGAYGSMTIPNELQVKEGKLYRKPVQEIYALKDQILYQGAGAPVLSDIPGNSFYGKIVFAEQTKFSILLGKEEEKEIWLNCAEAGLELKTIGVKSEKISFPADVEEVWELEIFVDRRVVEVYVNQGEAAGTKLFYQKKKSGCFKMEIQEEKAISEAAVMTMKSIWH